jgi:mono/diheme cytochrome c family protein
VRWLFSFIVRLIFALGILAIVLATVVYWQSNVLLHRVYRVTVNPPRLPTDAASLQRGRHLAQTRGCIACHGDDLGGAKVMDDPAMGRLYGPNLTVGGGGLSREYSDADFERAIRHGVGLDGRGLFLMPSTDFSRFTVDDMADVIAYVRSVPPVDRSSVPLRVGPVARALLVAGKIKISAAEIDHAALRPDVVDRGPTPAYGRYVAMSCSGCHGSNYSGGKIEIGPPDWPPAANLTPDAAGRLSGWTEADFIATLRTGRRPDGTELNPVMPRSFGQMDDVELKAVWSFLRTLQPVPTGVR